MQIIRYYSLSFIRVLSNEHKSFKTKLRCSGFCDDAGPGDGGGDGRGGDDDGRADPRRGPAPRARGHPLGPGSIGTLGFFLQRLETRWDVSAISKTQGFNFR